MPGPSVDNDVRRKLTALYSSPALLPQNLDLVSRRILLLEFDEKRYRETSFLDDRMIDAQTTGFWTGLETLRPPEQSRAAYWLFHIGHCGSTLLSRLLPALGPLLPVREPPPLRTLAESLRQLDDPLSRLEGAEWRKLIDEFVGLYSRTYGQNGTALIKPSSDCVNLAPAVLDMHPDSRGILIYQSLETYLATMLIGPDPRPDIEGHAVTRLMDLHDFLDDRESLRLYDMSPVQKVVVSWLAGVTRIHRAVRDVGGHARCLDFDVFVEDPAQGLWDLADFLKMPADRDQVAKVVGGPLMQAYAKAPEYRFSPSDRADQLADNRRRSSREIREGLRWAESMVQRYDALRPVVETFPMAGSIG